MNITDVPEATGQLVRKCPMGAKWISFQLVEETPCCAGENT